MLALTVGLSALMLAAQESLPLYDLEPQPPTSGERAAAEARERRRLPAIVKLCREASRSADPDKHVAEFADRNGLSTFGRLMLTTNCTLYRQGRIDASR